MNPRIYQPIPLATQETILLDENGSRHIGKVLRMLPGDTLRIFNGQGGEYHAVIAKVDKKRVSVTLNEFASDDKCSPLKIHLAQVMSRGDRMDYAIQKAVELGVNTITPLTSARCEVKLNPQRLEKRLQQWQQQVISACEQCGLNIVPEIKPCVSLSDFCSNAEEDKKIMLHPGETHAKNYLAQPSPENVCVIVGPEGGLNDIEINIAREHGFECLALGPRIFRTETAPVAMLTLLQHYWGDL